MIRPKSLQQRLSLFMILPVALLLVGMGIASFIYARTDVNRLVTADTRASGHFMTLFYAEIDPSSKPFIG